MYWKGRQEPYLSKKSVASCILSRHPPCRSLWQKLGLTATQPSQGLPWLQPPSRHRPIICQSLWAVHSFTLIFPYLHLQGFIYLEETEYVVEKAFSDMPVPARFLYRKGEFTFPQCVFMTSPFQSSTEVVWSLSVYSKAACHRRVSESQEGGCDALQGCCLELMEKRTHFPSQQHRTVHASIYLHHLIQLPFLLSLPVLESMAMI